MYQRNKKYWSLYVIEQSPIIREIETLMSVQRELVPDT